ncbi:hypothetical protein [Capybara microvirus Cap3_SP_554]|nr:hypothetical protein [Capybara microvirus Cap3_SP_554]
MKNFVNGLLSGITALLSFANIESLLGILLLFVDIVWIILLIIFKIKSGESDPGELEKALDQLEKIIEKGKK